MIRAVVFDLDDTLYREMDYVESGLSQVAAYLEERFGVDRIVTGARFMELLESNGRGQIFDDWLHESRLGASISPSELVQVYRGHTPRIALYSDVEPVLARLRSSAMLLGIITDGCLAVQQMKVRTLGLPRLVDDIVYTDGKGDDYAKPSPKPFLDIIKRFGVPPSDSIYIGNDPKKDFSGPKSISMHSAHITRSLVGEHACDADFHLTNLDELEAMIAETGRSSPA